MSFSGAGLESCPDWSLQLACLRLLSTAEHKSVAICVQMTLFAGSVHNKPKNPIDPTRVCVATQLPSSLHVRDFRVVGVTWKGRRWRFHGCRWGHLTHRGGGTTLNTGVVHLKHRGRGHLKHWCGAR